MSHRLVALLVAAVALVAPAARAQHALPCQETGAPKTFVLTVNWRAQDGKEGEVAEILTRIGEASRAEPGTLAFVIHRSPNDPHEFFCMSNTEIRRRTRRTSKHLISRPRRGARHSPANSTRPRRTRLGAMPEALTAHSPEPREGFICPHIRRAARVTNAA